MRRLHRWEATYVGTRPVDEVVAEIYMRIVGQRRSEQLVYAQDVHTTLPRAERHWVDEARPDNHLGICLEQPRVAE